MFFSQDIPNNGMYIIMWSHNNNLCSLKYLELYILLIDINSIIDQSFASCIEVVFITGTRYSMIFTSI